MCKRIVSVGGAFNFVELVLKQYSPHNRFVNLRFCHGLIQGSVRGVPKEHTSVIDKCRKIKGLYKDDIMEWLDKTLPDARNSFLFPLI